MNVSAVVTTVALVVCVACSSRSGLVVRLDGSLEAGGSAGAGGSGTGGTTLGGTGGSLIGGGTGWDAAIPGGGDAGVDASAVSARDSAASTDAASACATELGGICSTMSNDCAVCPTGMYVHPTSAGCGNDRWCCTNRAPAQSPCTSTGGVCVSNSLGCPSGWDKMRASCGSDPNPLCCVPRDGCGPYPSKCVEVGGVCVPNRWSTCPAGTEIHALGDQLGCGGWCCVDAPPSTCADGINGRRGMCVPGECAACFTDVSDPALTCEAGRSCCIDICD